MGGGGRMALGKRRLANFGGGPSCGLSLVPPAAPCPTTPPREGFAMKRLVTHAVKLHGPVGKTCKACHDDFRNR
ncbi:Cytochrome C' [Variovorax sp. HW608]|nr:Cytochrome C' [Variovorax sp. HW608]